MGNVVVQVERVDPDDDAALRGWDGVLRDAFTEDAPDHPFPPYPEIAAQARATEAAMGREYWLLTADGEPAGGYRLLVPQQDNLDTVEVMLAIHPHHRRRGHGRALVEHLRSRVRELGRQQVIANLTEPADGSQNRAMRFAAAAGAARSLGEVHQVLDVSTVGEGTLADLAAEAGRAAEGYELVSWTGRCPDELVDGYAGLVARLSTDAPMGDLDLEEQRFDAARVRDREASLAAQRRTVVATAARPGPDGPLVAYTDLVVGEHDPGNGYQWDTLVAGEHRGHRLGLLVKVANLRRLRATFPEVTRVHTWNADSNTYMVAINRALGFVAASRESAWRLDLPRDGRP